MRFLTTISFKIIILLSLLILQGKSFASGQDTLQTMQLPFSDTAVDSYLYKASMKFYKNTLTGIFVIKPQKDNVNSYRVVFLSELGMKYFDFSIEPDSFIIHQCILPLNKNKVLSILENDFRLMLSPSVLSGPGKIKDDKKIFRYKSGKELYTLYFNPELYLKRRKNMVTGAKVYYSDYINFDMPGKILLKHGLLNIEYEFNTIKAQE
jgi:hypothetical protein